MRRPAIVVCAVVVVAALGACSGGGDPSVPSAGGAPTTGSSAPVDPAARELQFVGCMREKGIVDMPDPVPGDTSGRSAVKYAIDVLGKGSDMAFQTALNECLELYPPADMEGYEPPKPSQEDMDAMLEFAECVRAHGFPDFPDSSEWGPAAAPEGAESHDPALRAAFEACSGPDGPFVIETGDGE